MSFSDSMSLARNAEQQGKPSDAYMAYRFALAKAESEGEQLMALHGACTLSEQGKAPAGVATYVGVLTIVVAILGALALLATVGTSPTPMRYSSSITIDPIILGWALGIALTGITWGVLMITLDRILSAHKQANLILAAMRLEGRGVRLPSAS
ncbi:MAG: hypothetical protein KF823_09045 [Xanthomonadales bacterium]|nr:hypothetical protein [Xanthomonadales bacterium]